SRVVLHQEYPQPLPAGPDPGDGPARLLRRARGHAAAGSRRRVASKHGGDPLSRPAAMHGAPPRPDQVIVVRCRIATSAATDVTAIRSGSHWESAPERTLGMASPGDRSVHDRERALSRSDQRKETPCVPLSPARRGWSAPVSYWRVPRSPAAARARPAPT